MKKRKFHEMERKIRDKQFNERTIAERLKNEYEDLRGRFEQMAFELRFSIEDELRIYARLLDELMKKSSVPPLQSTTNTTTTTTIRSGGIEDYNTSSMFQRTRNDSAGASSGIFDLASSQSGWPQVPNLGSINTENLLQTNENEVHETYDGNSIIRAPSFSSFTR